MSKIVAAILTKNEKRHITDCINSVQWADLVLLEDSFSTDGTVEVAQKLGATVLQSRFVNFAVARNNALRNAKSLGAEWIFFVDADERVTPELAEEIQRVMAEDEKSGWWVPRYNVMWGHTMRGGGWYPDCQLRLMKIDAARYDPEREVHEIVILDGEAGALQEHLIHYNYDSLGHFRAKQNRYIDFEAKILRDTGVRTRPWTYLTMPVREFVRRYFSLEGYKDGLVGLQLCGLMGWYTFLTYARLRRLRQTEPPLERE
jgi:glycosyltransferase involved in cell wall biosynthesis